MPNANRDRAKPQNLVQLVKKLARKLTGKPAGPAARKESERIDAALEESFPASDPPAYENPERPHRGEATGPSDPE